jgi:phage gp29-like protein
MHWLRRRLRAQRPLLPDKPRERAARALALRPQYLTHPGIDITPERLRHIYEHAENGYPSSQVHLFDDLLERDGATRNLYEQRALAVAGRPWAVIPGGTRAQDEAAAKALNEAMRHVPCFSDIVTHWLGATLYGYATTEIVWSYDRRGRRIVPADFLPIHPDYFVVDVNKNEELRLVTWDAPAGEPLEPGSWVVVKRPGTLAVVRRGLGRVTTVYSALKMLVLRNWVAYTSRFGIPYITVAANQFTDQVSRGIAAELLETFGDDGGAIIPTGMAVNVHDGARIDTSLQRDLELWLDLQNAKAINGVTLANDSGGTGSTHALGRVHADVRWEAIQRDAQMVQESFVEYVSIPFVQFNGLDAAPPSIVFHTVQNLAPSALVQVADAAINRLGLHLSAQQMRERLGFRPPEDDADRLPGAQGASGDAAIITSDG